MSLIQERKEQFRKKSKLKVIKIEHTYILNI